MIAGKKVQSALIGSRPRAFQRAINEPCALPLSPPKGGSKQEFLHLVLPFISSLQVIGGNHVELSRLRHYYTKFVEFGVFCRGGSLREQILGRWGRRTQYINGPLYRGMMYLQLCSRLRVRVKIRVRVSVGVTVSVRVSVKVRVSLV